MKVGAAGLQGARLARDRYGSDAERLVAAALEVDRWPLDRIVDDQVRRRQAVLARAARDVPHYRDWFAAHPDRDPAAVGDWPVVTKRAVQATPGAFLAEGATGPILHDTTSGTTGTPLRLAVTRDAVRRWYALYEARARRWYGVGRHDRWAILGGKMVARVGRSRPPHWVWSPPLHQLYLAANCLREESVGPMVRALRRFAPTHLVGYPSSLAYLARSASDARLTPPTLSVVIGNAEPLDPAQRQDIEAFFGCPARETYGMAEMLLGATECEAGALHAWPEAGAVEVVDDEDRPVPSGTTGRLVVTGLLNGAMPLIRYDTGDRGVGIVAGPPCDCGRELPRLGRVEGRSQDLIRAPSGEQVFWVNPVFHGLPVKEAQVVQVAENRLVVRVVPGPGLAAGHEEAIVRRLRRRVGDMDVRVSRVASIERGPGGKFRPVISLAAAEAGPPAVEPGEEPGAVGHVEDDEGRGQA